MNFLLCVLFVLFGGLLHSKSIEGKVIRVIDGDTITVLANKINFEVRLEGISAPQKGQSYSKKSKKILSKLVFKRRVVVKYRAKDRYGRIIGRVYRKRKDINYLMIKKGFAWHYKHFSKDTQYAAAEEEAKKNKRGLWRDLNPVSPWEFRRERKKESVVSRFKENTFAALKNDRFFHSSGCKFLTKANSKDTVYYSSKSLALNSKKRPCMHCTL